MKKTITIFLILTVLLSTVLCIAACAENTTGSVTATSESSQQEKSDNSDDNSLAARATMWLEDKGIPQWLIPFIISIFPILELRGGIIAARIVGMKLIPAFIICYIGNMLPIPFILLFIKKIFAFLRDKKFFGKIVTKLENRAENKSKSFKRGETIGVFLFVAIPIPGTGGWTGSLIASLLNMPVKKSFPVIAAGVFCAGLIMTLLMYGILGSAF